MSGHRSSDRIQTTTAASFGSQVLDGSGPIAVEFMSYGCAHCRVIEPVLQQVAEIVNPTEKIFRVNIGLDRGLAERYEIVGTPTLIMFLDGNVVGRIEGPRPVVSSVLAEITQPYKS